MKEILLIKCGEMVLKGLNRKRFEDRLLENIRHRLRKAGSYTAYALQATIYIEANNKDSSIDEALEICKKIFGIVIISKATVCDKTLDAMTDTAIAYMKDIVHKYETFKVATKRADKKFPHNSIETSIHVGGEVAEFYKDQIKPQMHNPDITIYVEIRDKNAYIYAEKVKGAGGMPVGTNGKALLLLSGGIDSPVAGYMMAKRGVTLDSIHFYSYPYTSEQAKQKVLDLADIVSDYSGRMKVHIVPFTKIQESIRKNCREDMFILIMRRAMMKIAFHTAKNKKCGALITGESLGQVASQTMEAINVTDNACDMPVFRPVIGMDKEEIIVTSKKIGAFETSILPYEDCCTVFTPRHPQTKPRLSHVLLEEQKIEDLADLIYNAVRDTEVVVIGNDNDK